MTARELGAAVVERLQRAAVEERALGDKGASKALRNLADEVSRALEWEAQGDDRRALEALSC